MRDKVLAFCRGELQPGSTVYCAVSGGADSMALLACMHMLQDELGISVCAAHFNHGLRGAESDADEVFVRDFCQRFSIPLTCARGDTNARVAASDDSLEEAARVSGTINYELTCIVGKRVPRVFIKNGELQYTQNLFLHT